MSGLCLNTMKRSGSVWDEKEYPFFEADDMWDFHRSLPGYGYTPLRSLPGLASQLGVREIVVKDESSRFGIQAFKALGASYAIYRFLKGEWENRFPREKELFRPETFLKPEVKEKLGAYTFCAATDGNHGRAVAWTARMLGQKAVIFMPSNSAPARIKHIEEQGAELRLIDGTFDDCVTASAEASLQDGWQAIADTAYPGYESVPRWIMLGYTTLFKEISEQTELPFDAIFLQAGVGGLSAAGISHFLRNGDKAPVFIIVEPDDSACFYESAVKGDGKTHAATGHQESIMAGLNCGIPSPVAWPIIRNYADAFLSIPDSYAEEAMIAYAEEGVVSGESGAAGLAGLLALTWEHGLSFSSVSLGLESSARVLLINTEGDTDPANYKKIVG